jgi:hypothetical protein
MTESDLQAIAQAIGLTRHELLCRIETLEARIGISGTQINEVADRLAEGLPVGAHEFLTATRRLAACDIGEWRPSHATWRAGR